MDPVLARHPVVDEHRMVTPEWQNWFEQLSTEGVAPSTTVVREIVQNIITASPAPAAGSAEEATTPIPWSRLPVGSGTWTADEARLTGRLIVERGLYLPPSFDAAAPGIFTNANAVRWSNDLDYRTAVWVSEQSAGSPFRTWYFENFGVDDTGLIVNASEHRTRMTGPPGGASNNIHSWGRWTITTEYHKARLQLEARGDNAGSVGEAAYLLLGHDTLGAPIDRWVYLGIGVPALMNSGSSLPPTPSAGLTIGTSGTSFIGAVFEKSRIVGNGRWTSVAHNDANYTGDGVDANWQVSAANQVTLKYAYLGGHTMAVSFTISGSTVAGSPSTLRIIIPDSKVATSTMVGAIWASDAGTLTMGRCYVTAAGTEIRIEKMSGAAWINGVTAVQGQLVFEVNY